MARQLFRRSIRLRVAYRLCAVPPPFQHPLQEPSPQRRFRPGFLVGFLTEPRRTSYFAALALVARSFLLFECILFSTQLFVISFPRLELPVGTYAHRALSPTSAFIPHCL